MSGLDSELYDAEESDDDKSRKSGGRSSESECEPVNKLSTKFSGVSHRYDP